MELNFTDDGLKAIAAKAMERKTGARGLRAMIEELLTDTMYDLPDVAKTVLSYEINGDVVANSSTPIVTPRPVNDQESLPMTGT